MWNKSIVFWLFAFPVFLAGLLYGCLHFVWDQELVIVSTPFGDLEGVKRVSRDGRTFSSFTNIPYAQPPVDDLRFQPPKPFGTWDGIREAKGTPVTCIQMDFIWKSIRGQEDCLIINVYTPANLTNTRTKSSLPVLVYIHGGHFMFGSSEIYGPAYFMDQDIVLVTLNYRVGALGFLNTGDQVVTGNMGLKDQSLALKWIQVAIKSFGGNPKQVMLFGESAGGASVHYQMMSKASDGLFHKALSQSASGLCPWAYTRNPKAQATRFGKFLNCSTSSSETLVKCLKEKSATELVESHRETLDIFHDVEAIFGPSIEVRSPHAFLTESPYKIVSEGRVSKIPFILGVNSEEGCFRTPLILKNPAKFEELNTKWDQVIPKTLLLYNASSKATTDKILQFYFGTTKTPFLHSGMKDAEPITHMYSDRYFLGCVRDAATLHSTVAPTYTYYLSYKNDVAAGTLLASSATSSSLIETFFRVLIGWVKLKAYNLLGWENEVWGTCHADDLIYLFNTSPLARINPGSPHYNFSKSMVKFWANFIKTPTDALDFEGVEWEEVKPQGSPKYLHLSEKAPEMINEPFTKRVLFWNSLGVPQNN